ncbi:MAG: rod shape-determining protein MreC [bacterium]|nr:rod shape-determining protein MreC [bacterium]MDE0374584.1 rod shape-determining protein MreC [bacterium]
MTLDIRASRGGFGADLRSTVQVVMAPLQAAVNAVVTPVVSFSDGLSNLAGLREENQRLRDRIESLEREAAQVGHLESQVSELETLLALRLGEDLYQLSVSAEVTARGGTLDPTLTIDRGTGDGVHTGQPVADGQGALIGLVSEAGEAAASVIPITSRRAPAVTVRLPDGQRGVVTGQGAGALELSILEASDPLEGGELLVTFGPYGDSNAYPKDLDVGIVAEAADPQFGTIRVRVEPTGDLQRLEYVAVIPWPPAPQLRAGEADGGA